MQKDYIKTSDMSYGAYLMLQGYTAIACVDDGVKDQRGNPRFSFYFTHTQDDIRDRILEHANEMREAFETVDENFQLFHKRVKHLHKLSMNPVRLEDLERL